MSVQTEKMTMEEFENLSPCRVITRIGPCLRYYRFVKENKATSTVASRCLDKVELETVYKFRVHFEPCPCCADHPTTIYPVEQKKDKRTLKGTGQPEMAGVRGKGEEMKNE